MSVIDSIRSGESILVGQIQEQTNAMSGIRLISLTAENLSSVPPPVRTTMIVSSLVYLEMAKAQEDGSADPEYSMQSHGTESLAPMSEIISLLESSIAKFSSEWPAEYQYARSVIGGYTDAIICVMPAHLPGSFSVTPDLFPSGFGGNVVRTPSPVSNWCRDRCGAASGSIPLPEGAELSIVDFEVPKFNDGL